MVIYTGFLWAVVLIQASAATDCSKQVISNNHRAAHEGVLLLAVHDELLISVPKGAVVQEMKLLEQAMAGVVFELLMLSNEKIGQDWGGLEAYTGLL